MSTTHDLDDVRQIAKSLRISALEMIQASRASHIGSCYSAADLLACLYWRCMNVRPEDPGWSQRDRMLMSKGHAAAILYAALAHRGYFSVEELADYCRDGSRLTGHVTTGVPGVELSTGSLGHALCVGCGLALAAKRDLAAWRTFVILSDGELDEGSNWEALLFASQYELDNLVAIIDHNKIQSFGRISDVLELSPLADKLRSFRWNVREIDGHDLSQIIEAIENAPYAVGVPTVIIANTVKGRGVDFMEDRLDWHYRSPSSEQFSSAIGQIRGDK
jgi:transketolase